MSITLTAVITNVSLTVSVELRVSPFRLPPYVQLNNHGIRGICSAEVPKSFADRIRYKFDLNSILRSIRIIYMVQFDTMCASPSYKRS